MGFAFVTVKVWTDNKDQSINHLVLPPPLIPLVPYSWPMAGAQSASRTQSDMLNCVGVSYTFMLWPEEACESKACEVQEKKQTSGR